MVNTRSKTQAARLIADRATQQPVVVFIYADTRVDNTVTCDCTALTTSALVSSEDFSRVYDMVANINASRQAIGASKVSSILFEFASLGHYEAWKQAVPDHEVFLACLDSMFNVTLAAHHPRGITYNLNCLN